MTASAPQMKTIFGQALEIESPADRAAFLDRSCGPDADLRAGVEALLQAHGEAGRFLDPAGSLASCSPAENIVEAFPEKTSSDNLTLPGGCPCAPRHPSPRGSTFRGIDAPFQAPSLGGETRTSGVQNSAIRVAGGVSPQASPSLARHRPGARSARREGRRRHYNAARLLQGATVMTFLLGTWLKAT
jgi:hypothetical protein